MGDFNIRIIKIAKHYAVLRPCDFAKKVNCSHQVASNYLKAFQEPSAQSLQKICAAFDRVNEKWLLTGQGEMLKPAESVLRKSEEEVYKEASLSVVSAPANDYDTSIAGKPYEELARKEMLLRLKNECEKLKAENEGLKTKVLAKDEFILSLNDNITVLKSSLKDKDRLIKEKEEKTALQLAEKDRLYTNLAKELAEALKTNRS